MPFVAAAVMPLSVVGMGIIFHLRIPRNRFLAAITKLFYWTAILLLAFVAIWASQKVSPNPLAFLLSAVLTVVAVAVYYWVSNRRDDYGDDDDDWRRDDDPKPSPPSPEGIDWDRFDQERSNWDQDHQPNQPPSLVG